MALTQAVRPPEPQRTDMPGPPGLGCFVAAAGADCCGRTWERQFTCNPNAAQKTYLSSQERLTAFLSVRRYAYNDGEIQWKTNSLRISTDEDFTVMQL